MSQACRPPQGQPKLPEDCQHCENREQNPLCSVHGVLEEIDNNRSTLRFKAGQTIFYAGNEPMGFYTIRAGLVKIENVSPDGAAHTLRLMGPGQALGYRALFAGEAYRATAIAVEDVELCFIPRAPVLNLVQENPQVAMNILKRLSEDLRLAEEKWVTQVDKDASARTAEALLFLTDHFKDQEWTRREVAEWAGTTPETVMRSLSKFEADGWITTEGRLIRIQDRAALQAKARVL